MNIIETLENIEHRMDDDGAPKREMKKLKNKKINNNRPILFSTYFSHKEEKARRVLFFSFFPDSKIPGPGIGG